MVAHEVEREIFRTCRSIFTGKNAHHRKIKKISEILQQQPGRIHHLSQRYSLNFIAGVVQTLALKDIFKSKERAQARFPELYLPELLETTEVLETQHVALDGDTAERDAHAVVEIDPEPTIDDEDLFFSEDDGDSQHGGSDDDGDDDSKAFEDNHAANQGPSQKFTQKEATEAPTIPETPAWTSSEAVSPVYLSYQTQHRILTTTQTMLEQTCFAFAQRYLPEVLAAKHWDCAEAVELTQWIRILKKHWQKLQGIAASAPTPTVSATISEEKSLVNPKPETILRDLRTLRNRAVHREPTSSPSLHILLTSAAALAAFLHNGSLAAQLTHAAEALEVVIRDTQADRAIRKARLDAELRSVEAERAELDRRERAAFDAFEEAEGKTVDENGAWLDGRVEAIFLGSDEPELGSDDTGKGKDASRTGTSNSFFGVVQSLLGIAFARRV